MSGIQCFFSNVSRFTLLQLCNSMYFSICFVFVHLYFRVFFLCTSSFHLYFPMFSPCLKKVVNDTPATSVARFNDTTRPASWRSGFQPWSPAPWNRAPNGLGIAEVFLGGLIYIYIYIVVKNMLNIKVVIVINGGYRVTFSIKPPFDISCG